MKLTTSIPMDTMTPWYYGHVYHDFYSYRNIKCLIPFHWPLRWWHYLKVRMNRPSRIDVMVQEAINRINREWENKFIEEVDRRIGRAIKRLDRAVGHPQD